MEQEVKDKITHTDINNIKKIFEELDYEDVDYELLVRIMKAH